MIGQTMKKTENESNEKPLPEKVGIGHARKAQKMMEKAKHMWLGKEVVNEDQ